MKFYHFLCCLLFFALTCVGQKKLTIEDAMINARTTLAPENLRSLQFIKGTDDYVYLKKVDGTDRYVKGSFKGKDEETWLTLAQLNERFSTAKLDTLKTLPPIQFNDTNWIVSLKGQRYAFNKTNKNFRELSDKKISYMENIDVSNAGLAAFTDSFNLFVSENGETKQVTQDGNRDIVYASSVHQSEFGITKGTFWSNDGRKLAFYRMDQTMVPDYPIVDWTVRPAKVQNIRYPMAGDKSHHVTVGIYNAVTGTTTWLKTEGDPEQYLTNIAWSPDDKSIYMAVVNRQQNQVLLNSYDAGTGAFLKSLFKETDSKYTEPLVPVLFVKGISSQFIWQSKRDNWNHLYLYNTDGSLVRQLTGGAWEVTDVKGFDASGENLFYVSTAVSPQSKNLYSVNLKTAKSKAITTGDQIHNTQLSLSGNYVIDNFSSTTNPRTIRLIEVRSGKTKQLLQATDPLSAYSKGALSIFTIKANDGTDLYARMFKPAAFDSTKKYPVVVYWYGGPHNQLVLNSWNGGAGDYWFQMMAGRGYVVFSIDTRGSSNRGRVFEQSIFRKAGAAQMDDMVSATNYLKSLSFVDQNNMGLFGWSYGGFMTTNFMLNHPGVFKAAVAGGPVMDWKYYEIMYTERYMDTPQENPEGYEATNLISQVDKLKGKLLLIHGLLDPVVLQQHSVMFVKAAVDKGIQVDYMIYPGHEHNVTGKDRAHLYQKVTDYFEQYLR